MRYLSVCSGIEAASIAWKPLGWEPVMFSEIEAFPIAVLKHHYPHVPVHGDFTTLIDAPPMCDLLCGGTPCQAFSIAGLRESLADDRGNLTLQFVRLANAIDDLRSTTGLEPGWVLWENVPGVLSTSDNAFGAFLGGLCGRSKPIPEPAGGWTNAGVVDGPQRCAAWRILDAQHFGLAQRRKRVFVLARGGAGRWAAADALLPIIKSGSWHPAPGRPSREGVAPTISARTSAGGGLGTDFDLDGGLIAHTLKGEGFDASEDGTGRGVPLVPTNMPPSDGGHAHSATIPAEAGALWQSDGEGSVIGFDVYNTVATGAVSPTLGAGAGEHGHKPVIVRMREGKEGGGKGPLVSEDKSLTLATANDQILAFQGNASSTNSMNPDEVAPTLDKGKAGGVMAIKLSNTKAKGSNISPDLGFTMDTASNVQAVQSGMQVRRLTVRECERLQGFPDDYTLIPFGAKKKAMAQELMYLRMNYPDLTMEEAVKLAADGPRYKALGNSWAVPCARWIGERIEAVRYLDSAA